jgi:hypothetical protein
MSVDHTEIRPLFQRKNDFQGGFLYGFYTLRAFSGRFWRWFGEFCRPFLDPESDVGRAANPPNSHHLAPSGADLRLSFAKFQQSAGPSPLPERRKLATRVSTRNRQPKPPPPEPPRPATKAARRRTNGRRWPARGRVGERATPREAYQGGRRCPRAPGECDPRLTRRQRRASMCLLTTMKTDNAPLPYESLCTISRSFEQILQESEHLEHWIGFASMRR